jgi:hypothetical protein
MKRLLLSSLIIVATAAEGRVLDLSVNCTFPASFAPSASQPFQLDWCAPSNGDDITQLLTQVANRWPTVFAVRAPSSNLTLTSDTIDWSTLPIKEFYFLEGTGDATLRLEHSPNPRDKHRLWYFQNVRRAVIGGVGLRLTFIGNHPGLGTGDNTQAGLIWFHTSDGSAPELADFRANITNSQTNGLQFTGGASGSDGEATWNRFSRVNVSGTFTNSSINVNSGVRDLWFDPDNTRVLDPYVRGHGWDGAVAGVRPDGIRVGCADAARQQVRSMTGAGAQYIRKISGGVTFEYGTPNGNIFVAKYIGDGSAQPYRIRVKDFGFSGPTEITGLPAGVMVKKTVDTTVMKHDPLPTYGYDAPDFRFLRFEQLKPDYGNGMQSGPIKSGCAPGNATDNGNHSGTPYIWRPEASRDGVSAQYVTAYVDVTIDGVTPWVDMDDSRAYFQASGSGADISPGPSVPDRTFGHILRATVGTTVPGVTTLLDTSTVTGPGSWKQVVIAPVPTDQGTFINPNDNNIVDTNVHGSVEIGTDAARTVIRNVNFTGNARKIISIGARSDLAVENICAPTGSTIEGSGSVVYQSRLVTLPYVLGETQLCTAGTPAQPRPPDDVIVE